MQATGKKTMPQAETVSDDVLRLIICGSVDDGKSTLIGRLLYDAGLVPDDQIAALRRDSRKSRNVKEGLDFSYLVDGLEAERDQGITIDVAYRYFATPRRSFIVADTPGHEQYTRNMASGASQADVAVLLIDARYGLQPQTRRHCSIVSLLGVRHLIIAVNKMDMVAYAEAPFRAIEGDIKAFAAQAGLPGVTCLPVAAVHGDNVVHRSLAMPWYRGGALLETLENLHISQTADDKGFRLPVQLVARGEEFGRGYAGTVAGGSVRLGDVVTALPSGQSSRVTRIVAPQGDATQAMPGEAVTLMLADNVDISRGDVLAAPNALPQMADHFIAPVIWLHETPLEPKRLYQIKLGTQKASAFVATIKYRLDMTTQRQEPTDHLVMNDIAICEIVTDRPLVLEAYRDNRTMGAFIFVDRENHATTAAGMVDTVLPRARNLFWSTFEIDKERRCAALGQKPCVVWFTGLSGAGKSTLANLLEKKFYALGKHTYILDGDNVRCGLSKDLGFSDADRMENIRRVAEVARLMVDAGLIVLVSLISPLRAERDLARSLVGGDEFVEIFVDAPLNVCEQRDPKGLYRKARAGLITNFTGIDSLYESPQDPELHLRSDQAEPENLVNEILAELSRRKIFS